MSRRWRQWKEEYLGRGQWMGWLMMAVTVAVMVHLAARAHHRRAACDAAVCAHGAPVLVNADQCVCLERPR